MVATQADSPEGPAAVGLEAEGAAEGEAPERRKVANLVRFVALFIAVPSVTTGLAMAIWDPAVHAFHMVGFLALGAAAVVLFAAAPRLARRWVPDA